MEAKLEDMLMRLCNEIPGTRSVFSFEAVYSAVFHLCLQKKYDEVHASLLQAIEQTYNSEHASWHFNRLKDISLFYSATCIGNGFPTFETMYQNYRPKPTQFVTPPSSP